MTLITQIKKRDGSIVEYDLNKVTNAILKANSETNEYLEDSIDILVDDVDSLLEEKEEVLTVECVQDMVEEVLLGSEFKETAKAYILYRDLQRRGRQSDIFEPRVTLKPYEYPNLIEYQHAIQHSYWLHTEFNYTSDIQDFNVNVKPHERNAIKNAMLAIAQVEVAVKNFWGDLHNRMPKPEVGAVGATFSANEVIHHDAYSHLLELLGLNDEFTKIKDIPELNERVNYLTDATRLIKSEGNKDFTQSLILFSLFIEYVSLFSQFLVIMSFNKHKNLFKGISSVIEATSKEENIHGMFGTELINIIKEENPEWFTEELEQTIIEACLNAYKSEEKVIDWIFEAGELDFLPKATVKEFIKDRFNLALRGIGFKDIFEIDPDIIESTDWFSDELISTKHGDFFVKRSINYNKRSKSITSDDLF